MKIPTPEIAYDRQKLTDLHSALGPQGIGAYIIKNSVPESWLEYVGSRIGCVPWRDNHSSFINKRKIQVDQRHDVCAYRLTRGDQADVPDVMRDSAQMIARFVRSLSGVFPVLSDWQADEVSVHRYDEPEIGLSRHRDNLRFWGLVVVLTLEGSSDFVIYDDEEHVFPVRPGDLALMRATNLIDGPHDDQYPESMNPEHGVVNVRGLPRTSLIVRDNLRPNSSISGFSYENWIAS